ncbi:ThiF family adenylyltransferase [Cytophaga sp. FL35]|uniref:ThiF family adenylyltransferase n=1 Tax=Cytophaga sp. FL35 TaxID=1904456 RepID=UPI001653AB9F|nr:ThiF family adenylyltransferase [Cytophaga sp. FL35]MBC7000335.1 ThiF family adenylyltransferase [Cytophaga sp. FL35]
MDIKEIRKFIDKISFVKNIYCLSKNDISVSGKFQIDFDSLPAPLDFEISIANHYPLRSYDAESIKFVNKQLRHYRHVMGDGTVCIHTTHNRNLEQKLLIDFTSLKKWIEKYYINNDQDEHYEHIIVPENTIDNVYYSFSFTEVDNVFIAGDFGSVEISILSDGVYKEKIVHNYFVQHFMPQGGGKCSCKWSNQYLGSPKVNTGLYYFIEKPPAELERFIFQDWDSFYDIFTDDFLVFLHQFEKNNLKEFRNRKTPLFLGYKTIQSEIHWQVALIEIGKFPIHGVPIKIQGRKTGKWKSELTSGSIKWAISRNASYKYFFGRGSLTKKITEKKILIVGIGAIGSMVATTLVRGGCKNLDFADFDVKEYENVCRSEYFFNLGMNDKVDELKRIVTAISPFVEIATINKDYFQNIIKSFYDDKEYKNIFVTQLDKYDIIFDCTTDDDLMYILDNLSLESTLINLSTTNKGKELVCGIYPNIYRFVKTQYNDILENGFDDLYNPTGCWSPTFKASYLDINFMAQYAIKHINRVLGEEKKLNNFIIKSGATDSFGPSLIEF